MFQSKNKYLQARDVLNINYKSPESDYRNLAIDIAEFVKNNSIDYYSLEKQLEKFEDPKVAKSLFLRKLLMILIFNVDLNQNILNKVFEIADDTEIKSIDAKNFFLANSLSSKGDYFNSLSLLFRIVGDKDFLQLNIMESFSVLSILKNLGFTEEFRDLSTRILL